MQSNLNFNQTITVSNSPKSFIAHLQINSKNEFLSPSPLSSDKDSNENIQSHHKLPRVQTSGFDQEQEFEQELEPEEEVEIMEIETEEEDEHERLEVEEIPIHQHDSSESLIKKLQEDTKNGVSKGVNFI